MNRADCLKLLATELVDEQMLVTTSLSTNTSVFASLRKSGPGFYGLNMGLCTGFAAGLALAFPNRKVLSLDSDGSQMVDTSVLISVADANLPNLVIIVFDNQAYARMGPTATSRNANLEAIARGAGIPSCSTVNDIEDFEESVRKALSEPGPHFLVAKVETETIRAHPANPRKTYGRAMREEFVDQVLRFPDYRAADATRKASV